MDLAIHLELVLWFSWDWLPGVVSFFSMLVQRKLLLFSPLFPSPFYSVLWGARGVLIAPRCAGTVPQECPKCVLNFGPGSFTAW